jgi:hypothetical protein
MHRIPAKGFSALVISVSVGLFLSSASLFGAQKVEPKAAKVVKPTTSHAVRVGVSAPMRTMKTVTPGQIDPHHLRAMPLRRLPNHQQPNTPAPVDPIVQRTVGRGLIPSPSASFDGVGDVDGVQPADTTMDVSSTGPFTPGGGPPPGQVLQWVNLSFAVYDKAGNLLGGPFEGTDFWAGLGGPCETFNGGDVLVRWDQFAQQWWVSQLAYPGGADGYHQCVAVSTTSDALGSYYQYDYLYSPTDLNDYPHVGMWPVSGAVAGIPSINDGYYVTVHNFANGGNGPYTGEKVMAFDRQAQLSGNPGVMQIFDMGEIDPNLGGILPADLRGLSLPADGSLETYIGFGRPDLDGSPGPVIHLLQTYTDFSNPDNSYLTQLPDIPVSDFDWLTLANNGAPQVGGGNLEVLNDRAMYRADYRVFGDHDSLLMMHDVNVGTVGSPQSGERWYEVRNVNALPAVAPSGEGPTLYQEGTYGPDDSTWRWMGSIGQDVSGNIAMGFSASSDGTGIVDDPSVHYTGRLSGDPLGTMPQGEDTLIDSSNPFLGFRWGDYSTIVVDPVDQCTFWYTTMYGAGDWATRIGSFKFASCTTGPTGTLEGTVTDGANPIPGAKVTAGAANTTTDAAGHYSFLLPVGTYDMTASKYGFVPGSVMGVEVMDGGDTVQDFELAAAPSTVVNGTVKDGSGGGWPLYAHIHITGPGAPTFDLYTDPVTGYYSLTLVQGINYNFLITAVSPGYVPGGGPLNLAVVTPQAPTGVVANWLLEVEPVACNAPGYSLSVSGLFENFSSGTLPPGWSITNSSGDGGQPWSIFSGADPCGAFPGNETGGSGPYALVNSNCDGFVTDDTNLITPSVDTSAVASPIVRFNTDYVDCCGSVADVDVSINGGASWSNIAEWSGVSDPGPKVEQFPIPSGADVKVRFHFDGFWAWWWQVDNVLLGEADCVPGSGGLVVGNVRSTNSGAGLNGATVSNLPQPGPTTTTFPTPNDPNQDDGFYILYADNGSQPFEASKNNYSSQQKNTTVIPGSTVRLDFSLASGALTASPSPLSARLDPGASMDMTLNLTNTGTAPASFQIFELNIPVTSSVTHGFASNDLRQAALARLPKGKSAAPATARGLAPIPNVPTAPPPARPLAGGNVLNSFPLGLNGPWGTAYDLGADNVWVSDIGFLGGNNYDYQYLPNGTATGNTIDNNSWVGDFAADGTYDQRTGMLWQVNVNGDQCIYELDPVAMTPTGNKICPNWGGLPFGERGLAFDDATETFYAGSWEDGVINHFDMSGNILDSKFVGLSISGLAFYPASGHLFVMVNDFDEPVTVLDAYNNYAVVGSFEITDNGSPVFGNYGGAGMEADCAGNLWLVNQNTGKIYQVASGEAGSPGGCSVDIPWLSEDPTSGTVPPGAGAGASNPFPVNVTFNGMGLLPGLRQAQLTFGTDTPVPVSPVPVNLTVRFLDVPDGSFAENFIYGAAGAGVMMGGPPSCPNGVLYFCPNGTVTRADMAGYMWRAVHGANTPPPVYQNIFGDVTFNQYNSFYIQGIYNDGITAGCGNGNYCPNDINTRAQMAVFIWKGQHGATPPPACTGIFNDVPCPGGFAVDYIEAIYNEGVTAGCGGGNYCPNANITNAQMSVFLVKGFNIPHL